jgi:hypothetical protein
VRAFESATDCVELRADVFKPVADALEQAARIIEPSEEVLERPAAAVRPARYAIETRDRVLEQPVDVISPAAAAVPSPNATRQRQNVAKTPGMKHAVVVYRGAGVKERSYLTVTATWAFVQQHWKPPPPSPEESLACRRRT